MGSAHRQHLVAPRRMAVTDRLAEKGIGYTRMHTAGVCASTRAAVLTGRNHHSVGAGFLVDAPVDRPGYDWCHPSTAATIARILALNGYATGAFGKMHETPPTEVTSAGPFDRSIVSLESQVIERYLSRNYWEFAVGRLRYA